MELKELLAIFQKRANLFFGIIFLALASGVIFYFLQPMKYRSELVLNVTRIGQDKSADYQFDDFYRLQADERFADTVVRWLETARIKKDIQEFSKAGEKDYFSINAKRLSSQMISVKILAPDLKTVEKIAPVVSRVINIEAEKLNEEQKKENWFKVIADEPIINLATWAWHKIILIALGFGIFVAFWATLLKYYLE